MNWWWRQKKIEPPKPENGGVDASNGLRESENNLRQSESKLRQAIRDKGEVARVTEKAKQLNIKAGDFAELLEQAMMRRKPNG